MNWRTLLALVVVAYALAHAAAALAGRAATAVVHDLAFSFSGILVGLLIGAVGVFLSSVSTVTSAVRGLRDRAPAESERIHERVRRTTRELRQNVLLALALVAVQGGIEMLRIIDLPGIVWPINASGFDKGTVLNAVGIFAAILQFAAVFDSVKAMFSLHDLSDALAETEKPRAGSERASSR